MNFIHTVCMQSRSAWAQPLATLAKYKENLQTWQPRAEKLKKKEGNQWVELWSWESSEAASFRLALQICARVSSLCLSPCPLTWVKGAFRGAGELFKSCVWVLVWKSGSRWRCTRQIYTPWPGEMKAISQAAHFPFPVFPHPPHPSAQAVLAPVQFNFSRAHRLVLSPSDPSVSPPRKKRLSYFLPL